MITQTIDKYVVVAPATPPPRIPANTYRVSGPLPVIAHKSPITTPVVAMNKLEYAMYIQNLEFKKGDIIVSKYGFSNKTTLYEVVDIDEVHRFVQWTMDGPMCMTIKQHNSKNANSFRCIPKYWKKAAV